MTDEERERDFVKERLKGLYEYLRIYSLFLAGLFTSNVNFILRQDAFTSVTLIILILFTSFFSIFTFIMLIIFANKIKINQNLLK